MKHFLTLLLFTAFASTSIHAQKAPVIFPDNCTAVDTFYSSYIIRDAFRCLEDCNAPSTQAWIKEQNKLSKSAINKSLQKTNARNKIDKYGYYKNDNQQKIGDYFFFHGYTNQLAIPSLYYRSKFNGEAQELVNPNYISKKDVITLKGYSASQDSKYLAYQFGRNGSDWAEIKVVNLENRTHKKDHLTGLKFSDIAWKGNGFYYNTYRQNSKFSETMGPKIYYHILGSEQDTDKLIFERKNPYIDFDYKTSSDERFFIVKERNKSNGLTNVFYQDFQNKIPGFRPLIMNYKWGLNILDSHDEEIIAISSQDNNGGMIIKIDPSTPTQWQAISPNFAEATLLNCKPLKNNIIAVYQHNQHPILIVLDYNGNIQYKLDFPAGTSVNNINGGYNDESIYFNFGSYTIPPVVYKFNVTNFKKELVSSTEVTYSYKDIVLKEVEYLSEDSVKVPMIIVHKKGLKFDGNNPTILKAYGGFGIVSKPSFDPGIVYFIKEGGVFAFANIRGGGDKGKQWAFGGRGDDKQNSFDDFIAGAEYLIKEKYTSPDKLATTGGSNGGLVVAAAAIQRPDLFKVVVPKVAPTDMLRFEQFTVGVFHKNEYGSVNDSSSFVNLYNYSPYHNIKEEINYPTMLVITSDNDDRVPPFHSYKFVAKLQKREAQSNPILLKVQKNAGHYGASTKAGFIKKNADLYGFIYNHLTE